MIDLQPHPLCARLPVASDADYGSLKAGIEANGQRRKITLFEGAILDGRHRYRACLELGIEPKFEQFDGDYAAAIELVIDEATGRHMTTGQKCWAAAQFMEDLVGGRTLGRPADENSPKFGAISGKSSALAALRFGVSLGNVENARLLMVRSPKLFARLGNDSGFNVHRAMQQYRREGRSSEVRQTRRTAVAAEGDLLAGGELLLGDCIEQLQTRPGHSVRMVFTDPPYDIGKQYHDDPSGDRLGDDAYFAWCRFWLAECARVLTPDGSIFVMIDGRHSMGMEQAMRDAGLHRRNAIYWWENNPENQTGNFSDAVRVIHYYTKSPSSFVFHDDVRVPSRRKLIADKRAVDDGKLPDNVWIDGRIPGNSLDRVPFADAPPQLPLQIPETCVKVSTDPGDIVLDPFNGNGTTAIAAIVHGRKYVGIERSAKYLKQSEQWIASRVAAIRSKQQAANEGA